MRFPRLERPTQSCARLPGVDMPGTDMDVVVRDETSARPDDADGLGRRFMVAVPPLKFSRDFKSTMPNVRRSRRDSDII